MRVGFLGLGTMGGGMAARIHRAGFQLVVHDPAPAARVRFEGTGVRMAHGAREVADAAEVVFACLPSEHASLEAALGSDGVAGGRAVKVLVETSTLGRATVDRLAAGLAAAGIALVDAPVSGGGVGAEAGTLSMVASGPSTALARARPAIDAFAREVFHVAEEPGLAQTAKLINNMLSTTGLMAAFEGVVMGVKAGLDAQTLIEFINVSTGRNAATLDKFPAFILTRLFGGKMAIGTKDLRLYIEEAERQGVPAWLAPRALEIFEAARAAGFDRETFRIIEYMEQRAGGVVVRGRAAGAPPAGSG